ncbi:MAG TPA: hypothetical protein ENK18_01205 [Deltaproteobacteria bacterium]|nr:hypothetical protein [Deltaproteobacteria bacterium]
MIAWLALSAMAQTEVCTEPYSRIQFGAAIGQVTDAFADEDLLDARDRLDEIADRLPCLEEVLDKRLFGKFARYMATAYFYAQDEEAARRWGLASRLADPDLRWNDEDFPVGHPFRELVEGASMPSRGSPETAGLQPEKGGALFLSGDLLLTAEAYTELPYLLQSFDKSGCPIDGWWQDGTVFPDAVLTERPKELEAPAWWTEGRDATTNCTFGTPERGGGRAGGGEPLPWGTVVGSGALAIASGVTYLLADSTARSLGEQTSAGALTRTRTQANLLVLASGMSLAGALGVGVGGVIVHANGFTIRF